MTRLSGAGFSKVVPTIKVSDLRGADRTIVTIRSATPRKNDGPGRKNLLQMRFAEFPEKVYYPNQTGVSELIAGLGDETDDWGGKKIVLVVETARNPQTNEDGETLHVAAAGEWSSMIAEAEESEEEEAPRKRKRR